MVSVGSGDARAVDLAVGSVVRQGARSGYFGAELIVDCARGPFAALVYP